MNLNDLEARIQRLEDIEAIKRLKLGYAAACDDNYNPDAIAAKFTEDAIWDGGPFGRYEGREAIREGFANAGARVKFAVHHTVNPIIDVDGDEATGDWLLWQPMVVPQNDQALWMGARYKDRYVRIAGTWLIKHLELRIHMMSPYELGFGKVLVAQTK
jgi:hypothetical protein